METAVKGLSIVWYFAWLHKERPHSFKAVVVVIKKKIKRHYFHHRRNRLNGWGTNFIQMLRIMKNAYVKQQIIDDEKMRIWNYSPATYLRLRLHYSKILRIQKVVGFMQKSILIRWTFTQEKVSGLVAYSCSTQCLSYLRTDVNFTNFILK